MKKTNATDAARIELLLAELRLPAMKLMWADLAARADKEGWPASRSASITAPSSASQPRSCAMASSSTMVRQARRSLSLANSASKASA